MLRLGRFAPAAALVFAPSIALAQTTPPPPTGSTPTTTKGAYSQYEQETIRDVSKQVGGKIELAPEGKTIEKIEVVRLEVIEQRDPAPAFLNIFHATSRDYVIDRQVLQRPGDRYRQTIIDETARNLALLPQLSLVVVIPYEGSTPDRVRIVVVTKDVWSLRLSTDFGASSGGLEYFTLVPSETNIAGTQQTILGRYNYLPKSQSFGFGYRVPRLDGRWLSLVVDANVIVNSHTGSAEGSFGGISIQRPLYSSLTEWSWATGVAWRDELYRYYVNAHEATFHTDGDFSNGASDTKIPYEYRARRITETAGLTRSYGWENKNDFTVGAEMNRRVFSTGDLSRFDPTNVQAFARSSVPISDTRVGPYAQWRTYTTNYLRVLDFETLGLQEDFRLGHDVWIRIYPVAEALGSSRNFIGTYSAAQYSVKLGRDGLARAGVESTIEASDVISDAAIAANARLMTPRLGFGRFVLDGSFLNRYRNYLNRTTILGGDTRLRGYPTGSFVGKDAFAVNAEFRSRPVEILACQLAGVAFFDVADAANGVDHLYAFKSAGLGLRALFPQFERVVWRVDAGFPVGPRPAGVQPVGFFVSIEQAFGLTNVGNSSAVGAFGSTTVGGALGQ